VFVFCVFVVVLKQKNVLKKTFVLKQAQISNGRVLTVRKGRVQMEERIGREVRALLI